MTPDLPARPSYGLTRLSVAVLLSCALLAAPAAQAQQSGNTSSLYYRLGGSSPSGLANNRSQLGLALGMDAKLRLNYSCGKFDIGLSWSNLMNQIANFGDQITNAVKAGIASLPLYILQRAQPGLYQLFQTYSLKADAMVAASLKTCEEMERSIIAGENPYLEWLKLAKADYWSYEASLNGDVVAAKTAIEKDEAPQKSGRSWVFGQRAGGIATQPLRPVRDLSIAGYNVTMNKPTTAAPTAVHVGTGPQATRLAAAFASPKELADFTTTVLGDQQIYLCQGISNCPAATTVSTAAGLGRMYDQEILKITPELAALVNSSGQPDHARLKTVSVPGLSVTAALVLAMRQLDPDARATAVERLSQELAMQKVVDKALVARNVLITGMSLPEVVSAGSISNELQVKVDRLTQYINDMMFEFRVRKEMTSQTALTILDEAAAGASQSQRQAPAGVRERTPLEGGRVRTNP